MTKGVIIHLENQTDLFDGYKALYDQLDLDLEYIGCQNAKDFDMKISENSSRIKAIIFDLVGDKATGEELEGNPEFLAKIEDKFAKFNLPIFIYSGHLTSIGDKFKENGTVFKISKDESINVVFEKIKMLFDSGFIDVFGPGGTLETEIKEELNKSFTRQFFENNQIEEVIRSIVNANTSTDAKERVKRVFKRIAIKTLASDLLAPVADSADKVHPIEHFYRRQSKLKIWTGDIWKNKTDGQKVMVLTPRCDLATDKTTNIIVCKVDPPLPFNLTAKPDKLLRQLNNHLIDNIEGKAKRYIPSNVFLPEGGMVNLALYETSLKEVFLQRYEYIITLSDDLTNEIIGKFAYYFLRTGITNINEQEFEAIIKAIELQSEDVKK